VTSSRLKKGLYIFSGIISLVLTYVGIIIPGFPAIPFFILAGYFFANSSPRMYSWMMRQRIMRKLMDRSKKVNRGVFKALMISQVWFSVLVIEFTLARNLTSKILCAALGVVLTALILIFIKTHSARANSNGSDK
jgi:uncharacterized protein